MLRDATGGSQPAEVVRMFSAATYKYWQWSSDKSWVLMTRCICKPAGVCQLPHSVHSHHKTTNIRLHELLNEIDLLEAFECIWFEEV